MFSPRVRLSRRILLADMEGKQGHGAERQHKAEVRLLSGANMSNSSSTLCARASAVTTCLNTVCISQNHALLGPT